jgi:hypothetical protein
MSIQKKSLISALKTTKKANVASAPTDAKGDSVVSAKHLSAKHLSAKHLSAKHLSAKHLSAKNVVSTKKMSMKAGVKFSSAKRMVE